MNIWQAAPRGRSKATLVLVALAAVAVLLTAAVPATARTTSTSTPLLAQGAGMGDRPSGAVRTVQRELRHRGYDLGAPGVDGRFGPLTDAAVRRAQSDQGLVADGLVGPTTRRALGLSRTTRNGSRTTRNGSRTTRRSGARTPSTTPSSNAKAKTNTKPNANTNKPAAQRPQPAATKDTNASGSSSRDDTLWVLAGLAALAAFCTALFLFARWSPHRHDDDASTVVAPINHDLFVEGRSDDEQIGEFRGRAVATTVTTRPGGGPGDQETRFLVDDARKSAPVWVRQENIRRSPTRLSTGEPVIGYVTLSPDAPGDEADGPARAIAQACEDAGWRLLDVVTDRENGRGLERPGLTYALRQIAERKARGLVVSDLRRLSRSTIELGALMEWFRDADAALIALDLGVDTSTPVGRELAATLITLSGWERERIARRTRSGLAEVRAHGGAAGRPAVSDRPELAERIAGMRAARMTLQAIADRLNAERVPTLRGGTMWRPSSVQAALGYRRPGASRGPRDQLPPLEEDEAR
jgi:DNA invertase Pin-like site-specific DNA recombinase/peptidoglycan hydrolase-like protein with peptidoglycan-binding domain